MRIPHSRPWITQEDHAAVSAVLRTGMLAQGEACRRFERAVADWFGAEEAGVGTTSGGAAITLALHGLGVGRGDDVVLPTYVCPSVMQAVVATGARPVLCDVGPWWVVDAASVQRAITRATAAIIVPHMYGVFADVGSFARFGVPVVEDCAQAFGPRGREIQGDVAAFSFHPTKCLTTGEGGMVVARKPDVADRLRRLRDGDLGAVEMTRVFVPLSDLAAALGLSQLHRYGDFLERRRSLAMRYRGELAGPIGDGLPLLGDDGTMHFRFAFVRPGGCVPLEARFSAAGVDIRNGVDRLVHRIVGLPDERFPVAVRLFESTVSIPLYPALTDDEVACVLRAARDAIRS